MFYLISSKLPLISTEKNTSTKLFRSFIVGSICYIVLHGYLFSQKFKDSALVQKYKKYIYYLWGADLLMTSIIIKFLTKSQPEKLKDNNEESEDDGIPDVRSEEMARIRMNPQHMAGKVTHPEMTRQQIMEEFYRKQQMMQPQMPPQDMLPAKSIEQNGFATHKLSNMPSTNIESSKQTQQKTPFIPKHEKITEESEDDMTTESNNENIITQKKQSQEKLPVDSGIRKQLKEISEKSSESESEKKVKKSKKTKSKKESESSSESVKPKKEKKKEKESIESMSETESDIEVEEYKSKK